MEPKPEPFDHAAFRRRRVALGVTLRELSLRTGMRPATISHVERTGTSNPDVIKALSESLRATP